MHYSQQFLEWELNCHEQPTQNLANAYRYLLMVGQVLVATPWPTRTTSNAANSRISILGFSPLRQSLRSGLGSCHAIGYRTSPAMEYDRRCSITSLFLHIRFPERNAQAYQLALALSRPSFLVQFSSNLVRRLPSQHDALFVGHNQVKQWAHRTVSNPWY